MRLLLALALLTLASPALAQHDAWDGLLSQFVVDDRWVDYEAFHADSDARSQLDAYLVSLAESSPGETANAEAMAYWINLYNALTIDLILDHYPLRSIKDISRMSRPPWKKKLIKIDGKKLTLDHIEHKILRKRFSEPRIHFALNCASVSCPPLAASAFTGAALDEQLEAAVQRALSDRTWLDLSECSQSGGKIRLTKIFDWFAGDFGGHEGVLRFLEQHILDSELDLSDTRCDLDYINYDWALNAPPN